MMLKEKIPDKKAHAKADSSLREVDDPNLPWPDLVRLPIFGIDENTPEFQFEWP